MGMAKHTPEMENTPDTQAIAWLVRLTSGNANDQDLQAFSAWRSADPRNEIALVAARQLWVQLGKPLESLYPVDAAQGTVLRPLSRSLLRPMLILVSLLLFAGVCQQWLTHWRYSYSTSGGELRSINLRDGSTLWLDSDSAVNIDIDEQQRQVTLIRGAAFFDVMHKPQLPFTVNAGTSRVRVLGTAFGVERDGEDSIITVQRGRVRVTGDDTPPVEITPNQQIHVRQHASRLTVDHVDARQQLAWHEGLLVFKNQPLSEIIKALKRYDQRVFFVNYPAASKQRLTTTINLSQLDNWYDSLESAFPLRITRVGPIIWFRGTTQS